MTQSVGVNIPHTLMDVRTSIQSLSFPTVLTWYNYNPISISIRKTNQWLMFRFIDIAILLWLCPTDWDEDQNHVFYIKSLKY